MSENMNTIIFCHGAPGSTRDAELLRSVNQESSLISLDILNTHSGDIIGDVIEAFDNATNSTPNGKISVIGFSIGAMVAIKLAAARPDRISRLTLISPAAPLALGDFLPSMAGKTIFQLAMKHAIALKVLTKMQALLSFLMPNILIGQLFQNCGEMEKNLLTDPEFRDVIKFGFANSFREHPDAYIALLQLYVSDWSADLHRIKCPVEIWHGSNDTWSPIAMAYALCQVLPGATNINIVENGEHYSTLASALLNNSSAR